MGRKRSCNMGGASARYHCSAFVSIITDSMLSFLNLIAYFLVWVLIVAGLVVEAGDGVGVMDFVGLEKRSY